MRSAAEKKKSIEGLIPLLGFLERARKTSVRSSLVRPRAVARALTEELVCTHLTMVAEFLLEVARGPP